MPYDMDVVEDVSLLHCFQMASWADLSYSEAVHVVLQRRAQS